MPAVPIFSLNLFHSSQRGHRSSANRILFHIGLQQNVQWKVLQALQMSVRYVPERDL